MTRESNTSKEVDLDRFAELVDAYGAEPSAWPERERPGALRLLEHSEEAVRLLEEAAELDSWLADVVEVEPSMALRDRILDATPRPRRTWAERWAHVAEAVWPFGPSWQPATALAASVVLGLTFGFTLPQETVEDDLTVVAELALETGEYWNELP
jgi:hypothetical protein